MASTEKGLNGSVGMLANAMRQVLVEAAERAAEPLSTEQRDQLCEDVSNNIQEALKCD